MLRLEELSAQMRTLDGSIQAFLRETTPVASPSSAASMCRRLPPPVVVVQGGKRRAFRAVAGLAAAAAGLVAVLCWSVLR